MHHKTKGKAARDAMRNPPEEDPEFQIAPMIDILLVLLVFFMSISSTEILKKVGSIPLAVAKDAKQPKKAPGQVVINVGWLALGNLGSIEVDERKYSSASDLIPLLRQELDKNPMTSVIVRVDRAARWAYEKEILKAISDAGVANLTFAVVNNEGEGK